MTTEIYALGYIGRKPAEIAQLVHDLDAVVFDVRFRPFSAWPGWCKPAFEKLLGQRYQWVKALGNAAYKENGAIRIVDLEAGVDLIRQSPRPVILMCACKDPARCHRTFIADHLRSLGLDVTELNEPVPVQLPLL